MSRRTWILLWTIAFAACGPREPLPDLPEVASSAFLPAVRNAVDAAAREAAARPNDAGTVGRFGMVLHAHSQFAAARQAYQRAARLAPKSFEWRYYLGTVSEGDEAVNTLREALGLRDYLPARLKLGEALLAAGDAEGARKVYGGLQHPAALFGFGRAANDAAYYEKALAAFPQYGAAMFSLAQHYQRIGRANDAQRLMSGYAKFKTAAPPIDDPLMDAVRALNRGPDSLLAEATHLERQGRLDGAAALQLKALELDPRLTQAHVNLISLYGRSGDAAAAERHYREAIALNPNAHEAYYNFGVLCYTANRRGEAEAAFAKALEIDPNYAEAHNNLGMILQERGKLAEAARHFEAAVEASPGLHIARFHLGRIYANQRRFAAAIEQFRRAAAAGGDSAATYLYALGATQARAGRAGEARSTLSSARDAAAARGQSALAAAIGRDLAKLK